RSPPAEKLLPRPASITTRTWASSARARRPSVMAAMRCSSKALCLSGRFSHSVATPALRSIWIRSLIGSHPENAEFGGLHGCIERGRQGQPENIAGLGRVDDAVVPQPCAGVERMALRLELLADRRFEGFFALLRP